MSAPLLIGIAGLAGVGKDTLAGFIQSEYGHRVRAFADPLRTLLNDRFGWQPQQWASREWKEASHWLNECGNFSPRNWMQWLGTDVLRKFAGHDIFVRLAFKDWDTHRYPMVLSDIRFDDEARAVKERGGFVIALTRPGIEPVEKHVSESGIDNRWVNAFLSNSGSIPALCRAARDILETEAMRRGVQQEFDFGTGAR